MAKYSRYDSRNKKRNRHKDQYLERGSMGRKTRERSEANMLNGMYQEEIESILKKYT